MRAIIYTAKTTTGKSLKIVRDLIFVKDFEKGINQATSEFLNYCLTNELELDFGSVERIEIS